MSQRRKVRRRGETPGRFVDEARDRHTGSLGLGSGIEFAPQTRELNAQRLDRLVLNRGLASAHYLEITQRHGLDERAADVEAEGEHGEGDECYQPALSSRR
jgi:hypothetical protein